MCGIVGYVGSRDATEFLIEGLRRLEYRGYDSAGISIQTRDGTLATVVSGAGQLTHLLNTARRIRDELALLGHEPVFCIDAGVRSDLPGSRSTAMQQRRRWEHGQLATLMQYGPRLIRDGILRARPGLIAMGADLMVPPLALLVGLLLLVLGAAGVLVLLGGSTLPAWIAGGALGLVGLGVAIGWVRYGRNEVPFRYLLLVPLYVAWKVPLYFSFLLGRREKRWRRTDR